MTPPDLRVVEDEEVEEWLAERFDYRPMIRYEARLMMIVLAVQFGAGLVAGFLLGWALT